MALGALEPDAEEGVAEGEGLVFRVSRGALHPEVGHRLARAEVGGGLVAVIRGLLLDVVVVALARLAAGGQHDAGDDLVVGHVFAHPKFEPLVPVTWRICRRRWAVRSSCAGCRR